jgi:hypothetical protein
MGFFMVIQPAFADANDTVAVSTNASHDLVTGVLLVRATYTCAGGENKPRLLVEVDEDGALLGLGGEAVGAASVPVTCDGQQRTEEVEVAPADGTSFGLLTGCVASAHLLYIDSSGVEVFNRAPHAFAIEQIAVLL